MAELNIQNVHMQFSGVIALDDVTFDVKEGVEGDKILVSITKK